MHADSRAAAVLPAGADAGPAPLTLSNIFSELGVRRFCSLYTTLLFAHCGGVFIPPALRCGGHNRVLLLFPSCVTILRDIMLIYKLPLVSYCLRHEAWLRLKKKGLAQHVLWFRQVVMASRETWKYLVMCVLTVNLKQIFRHVDATMPKFLIRCAPGLLVHMCLPSVGLEVCKGCCKCLIAGTSCGIMFYLHNETSKAWLVRLGGHAMECAD